LIQSNAAFNSLALDEKQVIWIAYQLDGVAKTAAITITGINNTLTITGDTIGQVTEDGGSPNPVTSGILSISDADSNQSAFIARAGVAGVYGTFSVRTNLDHWAYVANNASIQSLYAGETRTDSFTVQSYDGTGTSVVVTLNGVNDVPVITSSLASGYLYEYYGYTGSSSNQTIGGSITFTDTDSNETYASSSWVSKSLNWTSGNTPTSGSTDCFA